MTMWKRERNHFNYYVTNERKQPHIYVEALGTPSASTEKVLKDHGFKFDYNKCMYAAAQTNDLRLFVAHDLDKLFNYDIKLFFNTEAKKRVMYSRHPGNKRYLLFLQNLQVLYRYIK